MGEGWRDPEGAWESSRGAPCRVDSPGSCRVGGTLLKNLPRGAAPTVGSHFVSPLGMIRWEGEGWVNGMGGGAIIIPDHQ